MCLFGLSYTVLTNIILYSNKTHTGLRPMGFFVGLGLYTHQDYQIRANSLSCAPISCFLGVIMGFGLIKKGE